MQNFLSMVESHYKIHISSTNSTMSLIKIRLDISNLLSTKGGLLILFSSCSHLLKPETK